MSLRYRVQAVVGALLLAFVVGFLVFLGPPAHVGPVAAQLVLLGAAGALMVVSGFANPLRERAGAGRLVGLADVFLGVSLPLGVAADLETTGDYAFLAVAAVGGLTLVFIGIDYLRGGKHLDAPEP
jgi:hypothetical protein